MAFDAKDNFYVMEIQHASDFIAGELLVQRYSFAGTAPALQATTQAQAWWNGGTGTNFSEVRDASLAVDDNLATFTSGNTTVTDVGTNRVYIAVETHDPPPPSYTGPWELNTINLYVSTNNGGTFTGQEIDIRPVTNPPPPPPPPPNLLGRSHFQSVEDNVAPRISISQKNGQVNVVYDDIVGGRGNSVDNIYMSPVTPSGGSFTVGTRSLVATTSVLGSALGSVTENSPYSLASNASPLSGIGPSPSIAVDNSLSTGHGALGTGRIYVAYVDRYNTLTRFPRAFRPLPPSTQPTTPTSS